MNILFQSRRSLFDVPGGDTIQLLKTKQYLEKKGHRVDISTENSPDLSAYDIVHLYNLMRPQDLLIQAENAKKQRKKIALSTIYGLYTEYDKKGRIGAEKWISNLFHYSVTEYLKVAARAVKNGELHQGTMDYLIKGHLKSQSSIVSMTDVFLPNSSSEMKRVIQDFPEAKNRPCVVVPNGVDRSVFDPEKIVPRESVLEYKDCILCVARIEGRKNQLNLVRALKDLPHKLVLIGKAAPNHRSYYEQIKKEAGKNVHVVGQVAHDELPEFYKAAKVHVLASWMETPGLSSLEAGIMGCNLVATERGDTRDYFGDHAFYCEPDDVESIRSAILKACEKPMSQELREHILQNFTWERAAEKTLEGYELALSS